MNRKQVLQAVIVAGYHNDTRAGTRLMIENRISRKAYDAAFQSGQAAKQSGIACTCVECNKKPSNN